MKNKKILLVMVLAFVLMLGGAYMLYNRLSAQMDVPQLSAQETQQVNEGAAGVAEEELPTEEPDASGEETPEREDDEAQEEAESFAPDFTVYDLEGNAVKLSDFRGKPVVVNFWSSRCGPCKSEMPDFEKANDDLGEEICFLMVNMTDGYWDTVESASAFIEENGYTFPVFYDTDSSAAAAYGVNSLPTTYFIDAEGHGVAYGRGAMSLETLMRGIEMIRAE